ncbi:unnamed protein product [Enterobius vermicularis]|uniref:GLOBIN domain-containing protein n=1 Tax=Enterobius vermicularis TaxID=51028 RepID=A0A0N4V2T5_ENTVE|nr:unnamed protein product [Enterobius vermicularis]
MKQKMEMVESLKEFLFRVTEQLSDSDEVQRTSEEFGVKHVQFRNQGFRPDFFAITADAVTTECCFLDAAVHQSYDTVTAWSTLTSAMFSAVRDGYYNELRKQRRASSALPLMKTRSSLDTSTDGSSRGDADEHSRRGSRSISPMDSSVTKEETADESNKSDKSSNLLRPQLRGY